MDDYSSVEFQNEYVDDDEDNDRSTGGVHGQ